MKNHNETNEELTKFILDSAKKTIPLTKGNPPRKIVPWWNNQLKILVENKIKISRKIQNLNNKYKRLHENNRGNINFGKLVDIAIELTNIKPLYNRICAKFKKEVKNAKELSWKNYVNRINEKTPIKKIWRKFKKISGTSKAQAKHPIKHKGKIYHDDNDIANILGEELQYVSSNENYDQPFKKQKIKEEKKRIDFTTKDKLYYNVPITIEELNHALNSCRSTAPGPDLIHFDMIKNIGPLGKEFILKHFNNLWSKQTFPDSWRHATVIPILKPSKDPTDPQSYRPISLTSCLCKLMEKVVNNRLSWYLKKNKIITKTQFGSIRNRSTIDSLSSIEHYIRQNYKHKRITAGVFFDIEKAYDRIWKHHILKSMKNAGLVGNLPSFIQNFMERRTFQVKFNGHISNTFQQTNGTPQGSVLSGTLFILGLNPIVKQLPRKIRRNLYVDDFAIYFAARYVRLIQRVLNGAIKAVYEWSKTIGLRFSISKTQAILFYRDSRWLKNQELELKIGNHRIEVKKAVKFLGLYLDTHLNWKHHIAYIKGKAVSAINLLRKLSSTKWGSKRKPLTLLFKATVMSIINYCSPIYNSATDAVLKSLNPVQSQGLRICTGAFRSSPINSILCEAGEPPLKLQNERNTMKQALSILDNDAVTRKLFNNHNAPKARTLPKTCVSFPIRAKELMERYELNIDASPRSIPNKPPWTIKPVKTCLGLNYLNKNKYHPEVMKSHAIEHIRRKGNRTAIYTDGSKTADGVGFAIYSQEGEISYSLHPNATVFTAEIMAILYATILIKQSTKSLFTIYTDSRSSIEALNRYEHNNSLVKKTKIVIDKMREKGKLIEICWIPAHVGIIGNEKADEQAKKAIKEKPRCNERIPIMDHMSQINKTIYEKWQNQWEYEPNRNKLKMIKPNVNRWTTTNQENRQQETILTRLRIGHTKLTHGHLMTTPRDPAPVCDVCDDPLTIAHILTNCRKYAQERNDLFRNKSLQDILSESEQFSMRKIVNFLRATNLYEQM